MTKFELDPEEIRAGSEMKEDEVALLVNKIAALLSGHGPVIQGAVIADLTAVWVGGWHPQLRDKVLEAHNALIAELIPVNEKLRFGEDGHPGWKEPLAHDDQA